MFVGIVSLLLAAAVCWSSTDAYTWDDWTPLDEYVQGEDGYYSWTELGQHDYDGVTLWLINMTSQKWQDESFVSQPVWWHHMGIACPHDIRHHDMGFIYIGGTDNDDDDFPLEKQHFANLMMAKIANETGTCGGYIFQVPNQPLVFYNDPTLRERKEDRIIAWSWRSYLDAVEKDPTVVLRMPMTKAAKRGLDAIHDVAKAKIPSTHINYYYAFGASKRGWTVWSLASTDRRVVVMTPVVFSLLNMMDALMFHYQNLDGGWSFAFEPYYAENLTAEFHNPEFEGIMDVEDMYRYRDRVDGIPKLEMLATGDEFFLLDDTLNWWHDMPGPKWMMFVPNAEHTLAPQYAKVYESITGFWLSYLEDYKLPVLSWTMQETELGGLIVMDYDMAPYNVTAWSATTLDHHNRRDFRLAAINETSGEPGFHPVRWYEDVNVVDFGNGYQFGASAPKVDGEWVGYFIQTIYEGPEPYYHKMYFSTQVNVIPYTRPRGPCTTNEECYGYLI